ncbi:MAG: OmpA family protein [Acidobacteriota bacterium]
MAVMKPWRGRVTTAHVAWSVALILVLACAWLFVRPQRSRTVNGGPAATAPRVEGKAAESTSSGPAAAAPVPVPLAPGLTIVSVAADRLYGDQHTITEVTSVTADAVTLKVSLDSGQRGRFDGTLLLSRPEMAGSLHYNKIIYSNSSNTRPRMGSYLGPSAKVMTELKGRGNATFFDWREPRTQARRFQTGGGPEMAVVRVKTLAEGPASFPVLVNGRLTRLPAIHVRGTLEYDFGGPLTDVEFDFLDSVENPLTLHRKEQELVGDVTQIWLPASPSDERVERQLRDTGRMDVYGIFFDFGAATIRPGFEKVVEEIADALKRNPSWALQIDGHTDNIGSVAANQALSERRAAEVKKALVETYKVDAARLTTAGFGASRAKDSNDTLIGRARNRRVELVRGTH